MLIRRQSPFRLPRLSRTVATLVALVLTAVPAAAEVTTGPETAPEVDELFFPVELPLDAMDNTWGAPRSGGRSHTGTDILAPQMAEVYAAMSGEIIRAKGEDCADGQVCRDYYLAIAGDDGRGYLYIHLNDDTPDRPNGCDGLGGVANAFAPQLVEELQRHGTLVGVRVETGELIGYNGSSGNADCGVDHIHFEIWNDHNWGATGKVNPYDELVEARDAGRAVDSTEPLSATSTRARLAAGLAVTW